MKLRMIKRGEDFDKYSPLMQKFESQFDYPLGDQRFSLRHGNEIYNYFDFFRRLGNVNFFIVEDNNEVVGAGCAILKNVIEGEEEVKHWYLADFKLTPEYRKKGILKKLTIKYFLSHYFKSNKMIALNMSPMKDNGLIKRVKGIFSWFNVRTDPFMFYEWNKADFCSKIMNNPYIRSNYMLFTNNGLKDIIIEGKSIPLYHLVRRDYGLTNYTYHVFDIKDESTSDIPENALFMLGTVNPDIIKDLESNGLHPTLETTFISHKINIKNCNFFTGEI